MFSFITQLNYLFSDGLLYEDVYWTTAIQLSEYEGYRSVSLLSYEIPTQANKAVFTFLAKTSGSSCKSREVHVYVSMLLNYD